MPARRRHYPGRGPALGTAGTRAAYDSCVTCGHPRIKHLTQSDGTCTDVAYQRSPSPNAVPSTRIVPCPCPRFKESEE